MDAVDVASVSDRISSEPTAGSCCLQKFRLYETRSNFYMLGRDKGRTLWRVLKVDRLEAFELNVREDSTRYSESECNELLKRIHEGNRSTGGLRFVTNCYGIVGYKIAPPPISFPLPTTIPILTKTIFCSRFRSQRKLSLEETAPNSALRESSHSSGGWKISIPAARAVLYVFGTAPCEELFNPPELFCSFSEISLPPASALTK
ncbi:Phosphoinositide phosphatase SAC2 [Platanthera guangdongensis]|uniref:Phosphoinositide phosphatase SAC2 n=1 Tax=Platanthera guangdongensis TaxID=2320717 RepID=A0ABR2MR34_9ASPA